MAKKIHKVGAKLYIEDSAGDPDVDDFPAISYPDFKTNGDNVEFFNIIEDKQHSLHNVEVVAIADVRDVDGNAIGGNTKSEVRDYLSGQLAL